MNKKRVGNVYITKIEVKKLEYFTKIEVKKLEYLERNKVTPRRRYLETSV